MTYEEKMNACKNFINAVDYYLEDYEMMASCNHDASQYLIPKGTEHLVTYYGKPDASLRFSDHWNWFASSKRCSSESYVQCRSLDMPWVRKREKPGESTKPRFGIQVSRYDASDDCYHHVFGDKFDRHTRTWTWIDADPMDVAADLITRKEGNSK